MSEQLAYAAITPYSLNKSRTGGIIARLVARSGLNLAGACMFAPSQELANEYASIVRNTKHSKCPKIQGLLADYILKNFAPNPKTGRKARVMVLLFRGENAIAKVHEVVGEFTPNQTTGETIRDTFGDLVFEDDNSSTPIYLEPAVLSSADEAGTEACIRLWSKYYKDAGILTDVIQYPEGVKSQVTLAMIKPDNFRFPMGRPGNVIDFFSRTGLNIIGIKVQRMSTAQALEFYGPVREVLCTKLVGRVASLAKPAVEKALEVTLDDETTNKLGELLCPAYGNDQFDSIVRFMSGRAASECTPEQLNEPGTVESVVLLYQGSDAIAKIRKALGPTDPSKAPPGSIRREFGSNVMVNAAHASDSEESVRREMDILVNNTPNGFKELCDSFCK